MHASALLTGSAKFRNLSGDPEFRCELEFAHRRSSEGDGSPGRAHGRGGNDTLTLDFSNGNFVPAGGIDYDGSPETGAPGDSLVIVGNGTGSIASFNTDGSFPSGRGTVRFRGLKPVTIQGFDSLTFITSKVAM
jgi:hypothetical protein